MGFSPEGNLVITFRIDVPKNPSGKLKKTFNGTGKGAKGGGRRKAPHLA
jgi:hypothetical protein